MSLATKIWNRIYRHSSALQVGLLPGTVFMALAMVANLSGAMQLLEWGVLDRLLLLAPPEPLDDRIVLITIDEQTLQKAGTYPISDRQLNHLLQTLQSHNPRVIGLDVFRDLPVEPGYAQLSQTFEQMENLIGIDKVLSPSVAAPPTLPSDRIGIVDAPLDSDGRQRRALLGIQTLSGFRYSFAHLLAQTYLAAEGITLSNGIQDPITMRFGNTELPRLQANFGSYRNLEAGAGDMQILLRFRQGRMPFRVLSVLDIETGKFDPAWLNDRILLIGTTAASSQDYLSTATRSVINPEFDLVYGLEIQAHVISQILSAVLDQRPLLKSWSDLGEWLWTLTWGLLGIGVAAYGRSPQRTLLAILVLTVSLVGISYLIFLAGWWIPIVLPVIVLLGNGFGLAAFYQYAQLVQTKLEAQHQAIRLLEQAKEDLEVQVTQRTADLTQALEKLKATQAQIVAQEKLASLGALTAGIAHEIRNPLNFVNNFAALSIDLVQELREEIVIVEDVLTGEGANYVKEILDDLSQNSAKISEHGKRVDDIIRSMVSLSQGRTGEQQLTNIHALLSDVLNLAYHGKQSKDSKFQVHIVKNYDQSIPPMLVFSVDLNRAFLNIINMLVTL